VTIRYAEQITTLSLIGLRRLRFPVDGAVDSDVELAARVVLAALGICAATLAFEAGVDLRSRCLLWPDGPMRWQLLDDPAGEPKEFTVDRQGAIQLLRDAAEAAVSKGVPWPTTPVTLKPSAELVKLVRLSQLELAKAETA
jgi:CRISPR-associated protein Csb1